MAVVSLQAYEWALAAMKVVGRVKGEGLASPEQVGAAARTLTAHLEEHPPIPEDTFTTMTTLAARLNNHTLLQQCKVSHPSLPHPEAGVISDSQHLLPHH